MASDEWSVQDCTCRGWAAFSRACPVDPHRDQANRDLIEFGEALKASVLRAALAFKRKSQASDYTRAG